MADLVKLKTGKIDKLASVDQDNKPVVPLEAGNVYFAVDTTTHKGKIVYDAPNGTSVDRIVMSTDAEKADSADKALTADKAVTLVAARNIDGINFNGGANVIHYTTCATNASKVEKTVTINGFALISGARISVRFANTNSADSPTLNVSGTGAKPILYNGTNIPTAYLTNNKVWDFIYDGDLDAWIFVGDKNIDTNTTYAEATATKSGLMSASDKTKLDTIQSGAKVVNYESHLASGVKVGTITIGGTATDIFSTTDTWTAFKGATADAAGSAGYIGNAPAAGEQNAFFTGAGTWKTLTVADDKNNGLMSSDDRTKLDSIESNANYTYLNASAPISVNKHVGIVTISHDASGATAGTYGTNSSTALTPGFGESFSVTGFQVNATGHVTSASNHNVKMPDTLVDDTHRGLMSSDMYLAWNKGITLAGHQLLLGSAWSKTDFLDTLGLTNALRWIGNATVAIADGSKIDPKVTGYDFSKAKPGDVVLDKDNKREYAWTLAGAWESLGPDGDLATADHRHANATSTTDGFMSADDKAKLDTVESKANYIYVSANAPISVDKHVGALTITHNTSGVTADAYGDAVAQAPGFGASFLVPNLTVNATGHVTVAGAHTVTIPNALVTDKTNGLMSADDKARFDIIKDGYYVKRSGDTMTGDLCFSNVGTGVRQIQFLAGDNDYGRLAVSATGVNAGWMELATADDGTEPIYVRQYTGPFATIKRTLTLLDASGNTILPGTLTAAGATINGATTINSTLHTTGATTLDSTLSVGGTATMKGALNVNGITNLGSSLTVSSGASIGGALSVSGNTTLNSNLSITGDINLANNRLLSYVSNRTIDLSATTYDVDTYYPVVGSPIPRAFGRDGYYYLKCAVSLDSGTKPSWATHERGFTCDLEVLNESCGYGVTYANCIILADDYKWTDKSPVGYSQMGNSSYPVFWLRGGGKYALTTNYKCEWSVKTASFTNNNESVAPSSSRHLSSFRTLYLFQNGNTIFPGVVSSTDGTDSTAVNNGSIHTNGGLGVAKQARIGGGLTVGGFASISGALSVGAAATLASTLTVNGATTLNGTLTVNKAATIYGTTSLGSTLYMNGHTIELGGVGTNLIHATSTDAAYGYGGAYNNVVIEAWSGFSIGTACRGQTYTGKNAFSVNARTGETYVGGSLHANNSVYVDHGYLVSTNNGNTVQIGSANGSYMHFTNSANIPFWFNHDVHVQGNIYGGASYNQRLPMNDGDWGMTFHWNGQGGQPTWLWGGNNVSDMYVYNPSNFHVKEADILHGFNSRGDTAGWGNQTGTGFYYADESHGGSIGFRRDNPSAGKMSMVIDGTVYTDEGQHDLRYPDWTQVMNKPGLVNEIYLGINNDFTRVVIALCRLTAKETPIDSFTSGALITQRDNGLTPTYEANITFNGMYGTANAFYYTMNSNFNNNSTAARGASEGFRPCTFTYNGVNYGGIEFYQTQARRWHFYGIGSFTPFKIDYYNVYNNSVLNEEINNSLQYTANMSNRSTVFRGVISADAFAGQSYYVRDSGNGSNISISYSKASLGSTSWLAAWNGYELRAISPDNVASKLYHQEKTIAVADWTNSALTTNGITYPYCYSFNATGVTADETIAWLEITSGQQVGDMVVSTGAAKISVYTTVKPSAALGIKVWYIGKGAEGSATITQYEQLAQRVENATKSAMLFYAGGSAPSDTSGRTAWLDTTNKRLKFYWDGAWRAVNTYQ